MVTNDYFDLRMPRVSWSGGDQNQDHETLSLGFGVFPPDLEMVIHGRALRRAVERCAIYFRREFRYDFVQYSADELGHPKDRAFLWEARSVVVGACSFRWVEWEDADASYTMDWVWFHPYERRQGNLSSAWLYFRRRFGRFHVEQPLSDAMEAFLARVDPPLIGPVVPVIPVVKPGTTETTGEIRPECISGPARK